MPGRIRTIKPEWLEDEVMASASSDARVLSIALILMADDYGNGRCQKTTNAARVFPPSGDSPEDLLRSFTRFEEALSELVGMRFVGLYGTDAQHYFTIRNWKKHQKVNHPGKPLVPGPPAGFLDDSGESQENCGRVSREPQESLLPDRDQRPTTNDQDREGTSRVRAKETPAAEPSVGTRRFTESLNTEAPELIEFTEEHRKVAADQGLDLEQTWLECRDQRRAKGYRCANWPAEFLAWLRRERKFAQSRASPGKRRGPPQPNDEANRYRPPIFEP